MGNWRHRVAMAGLAVALSAGALAPVPAGAAVSHKPRLSPGLYHTCAALPGGNVECWGLNLNGDLGSGSNVHNFRRPVKVIGLPSALSVAAMDYNTCALTRTGTVKCWGINAEGEAGNGNDKIEKDPVGVSGLTGVTAIAAAGGHACALLRAGTVKCWGQNKDGVLGNGTIKNERKPVAVHGLAGVASIVTSGNVACALLKKGTAKCWGQNSGGQLGNGAGNGPDFCAFGEASYACSTTPVTVKGLTNATALAVGDSHVCALLKAATVKCWGGNLDGELGNGTTKASKTPVAVTGLTGVVAISAAGGSGDDTCAVLKTETVKCWGNNRYGQLGNGSLNNQTRPVFVAGLTGVASVSNGTNHTCAFLVNNHAKCWGNNLYGQLGNGTATSTKKAVNVIRL
jgi:alpha-tubulin suppressor-like RCC1 family protein